MRSWSAGGGQSSPVCCAPIKVCETFPLGGPGLREPQFTHHRFAHCEFLRLSGHGFRQFLDESYIARNLVMRDLAPAEFPDLVFRRSGSCLEHEPGADFFTEL